MILIVFISRVIIGLQRFVSMTTVFHYFCNYNGLLDGDSADGRARQGPG